MHDAGAWSAWAAKAASVVPLAGDAAGDAPWQDATGLAIAALASSAMLLAFALAGAALTREGLARSLQLGRDRASTRAGDRALYVAGTIALSQLLDRAIDALSLREGSHIVVIDATVSSATVADLPMLFVALAVAPALAEELLFRGFALRQLGRRFGAPIALLVTASLFGVVHQDLAQGGAAVALGLYLGAVAVAAGGVRTAMLCHLCNNGLAIAAWLPVADGVARTPGLGAGLDLACLALVYAAVRRLAARWPRHWPDPPPEAPPEPLATSAPGA